MGAKESSQIKSSDPATQQKMDEDFFDGIRNGFGGSGLQTFHHQFSLRDESTNSHICSVSLIHPLLLLTAAHCVFGKKVGGMKAVTGSNHQLDLLNATETEESRGIRRAILHPNFDNVTLENDIALLVLDRPVRNASANGASIIAQLPQRSWNLPDSAILTGWGLDSSPTEAGDEPSGGAFEAVNINIDEHSDCLLLYRDNPWNRTLTDSMLCAGYTGNDSCKEIESAGVLVCQRRWKPYICGIGSWGYGCESETNLMVYTDVAKHRNWISREIRKIRTNS